MVETCRWPKASYSVSSMACVEMPKLGGGQAVDRQAGLQAAVLLVGVDVDQARRVFAASASSLGPQSLRSFRSSPCSVY